MSDPADATPTVPTAPDGPGVDEQPATDASKLDLDGIERDLADVESALARLDSGEYWTDEVTGAPIPDELLAEHPTARRLADR
jgi:RNA polymerase-binding transcription factor DksA